jgi:sugar phosphate isomerase/epimerase
MTRAAPTLVDAPVLKGRFPFRLGCTSFVLHADVDENVLALAPIVDDIEIVIFESDELAPLPDKSVLDTMRSAEAEHGVTYTIHLPLDVHLASLDAAERERAVGICSRVIRRMREVEPFAYVVHVIGDDRAAAPESLASLAVAAGDPRLICVENLAAPTSDLVELAAETGASLCFDVGHAIVSGHPPEDWLAEHLARVRVVHAHGIAGERDHRDVSFLPEGALAGIVSALACDAATPRVLTLEVFSEADLTASLATMEGLAP